VRKRVSDISEAIELATAGNHSGKWDLFRGQTRADWFVTSSAGRLPETAREDAWNQFQRFATWARSVDAMANYVAELDSLWAVAQHYGLRTQFIDFTDDPRVAAFFSCDTQQEPDDDQEAAIICLNTEDFLKFWKGFERLSAYPEIIRIDVENLWRLQKQRGCFLWNPIENIEHHYDFDRIVFPFVKDHPSLPRREEIYPVDQSELEKMLTHFFMNEQLIEGTNFIDEHFSVIRLPNVSYDVTSWWPSGISLSEDWNSTEQWSAKKIEHADDALQGIVIEFGLSNSIEQLYEYILRTFTPEFIEANRDKAFGSGVAQKELPSSQSRRLIVCVRRLWNGMRTLPYAAPEINTSISYFIKLFELSRHEKQPEDAFGPDGIEVEIGSSMDGTGAYSRGTVTTTALVEAYNPEFLSAVRQRLGRNDDLLAEASLHMPARPWERFTFSGLRTLMVEQLIPTQVVWRGHSVGDNSLREVIYFSPKELKVFGLP
jgi:hypothetical protein